MKFVVAYLASAVVFALADLVWLGLVARGFYRSRLGGLLAEQFNIPAALAFYVVYIAGIVVFAILPAFSAASWTRALAMGALFGFFAYMTYDLTNLATLRGWPVSITLADIAWGTAVTAISATAGYLTASMLFRA